jgi:hypothetical protein
LYLAELCNNFLFVWIPFVLLFSILFSLGRPTFCCHCFLKMSEHSRASVEARSSNSNKDEGKSEKERLTERKKLLLPAGFEAAPSTPTAPSQSSPLPTMTTTTQASSGTQTPSQQQQQQQQPPSSPKPPSSPANRRSPHLVSPRLNVTDLSTVADISTDGGEGGGGGGGHGSRLSASGSALSPRLYTQGTTSTVQSPVRELGLSPQKSARLFRKLSQRSLVSDMVAMYEVKERARADTLSPTRAKTVGTVPPKEGGR